MKCGFVAVIGAPNVGKSSLVNRLVGEKVAIVSPKPQTTRVKTLGILNEENLQIIFIDTPGFINKTSKLNEFMEKNIQSAKNNTDVIMFVLDGTKDISCDILEQIKAIKAPSVVVFNKMDLVNYEKAFKRLDCLNRIDNIIVVPVSAETGKNIDELKRQLAKLMPEGEALYNTEEFTDKSTRFIVSELIREKILWLLNDEIPHGISIDIIKFEETAKKCVISADIICEKENHKPIIIGKGGAMLKKIGENSRIATEKFLKKTVFLELFVKVRENWRDNEALLKSYGYNKKDI